jgi:hypothetical protein
MADESMEATLTKLAYDERNSYVMQYLQKVKENEIERSDSQDSSPEPQSHQLHEWKCSPPWETPYTSYTVELDNSQPPLRN